MSDLSVDATSIYVASQGIAAEFSLLNHRSRCPDGGGVTRISLRDRSLTELLSGCARNVKADATRVYWTTDDDLVVLTKTDAP